MPKLNLLAATLLLAALPLAAGAAENLGTVKSANRAQLNAFDANGAALGQIKAADLKLPQPVTALGKGGSIGVRQGNRVVYLRGLDVNVEGLRTGCKPVQVATRAQGSAYAGSNMGLGGAADCSK